jgi:hypothetical protein
MASGSKEHRMLFDIRGKRRHVVKVVYAVLALLMGLSLFLVTGGASLSGLIGSGNSGGSAVAGLEEQTERLERKLVKDPENPDLLLALTRSEVNVANQLVSVVETEAGPVPEPTSESRAEMQRASESWSKYLEATDKPSAGAASVVAPALYSFAISSPNPTEIEANMKAAANAQQIIVDQRPNLNSWSTLAIYRYLSFEYAAAEKAEEEAKKLAASSSKFERENLENQLEESSKGAHKFQKQLEAGEKAGAGSGKAQLENPFGGLGGP